MLIGFKVKNFRSFNDMQHFSMIAGKTRNFIDHISNINDLKILKFSSIYGANASGKSNLVLAIDLGKKLLLNNIQGLFSNQYFRIHEKNKEIPSYFEYEIAKNNKLYSYGFEVNINKKEIVSEWLIDMTKNNQFVIFERDAIKKTIKTDLKIKDKVDGNRFEVCQSDILNNNNIFFLTEMTRRIQMNDTKTSSFIDFENVFDFFINDLQLVLPNQNREIKFNYFSQFKNDIKPLLKMLGLDIDDLLECESNMSEIKDRLSSSEYNKLTSDINQLSNNVSKFDMTLRIENCIYTISGNSKDENLNVKVIKILHTNSNTYFDTYEESDGTLRILELIDILLSDNKVFVIDEIDRSLHPSLTIRFVNCFLKLLKNRNIQLIITTHESRLLNYNFLRRDEVWFSEKRKDGSTKLYSLEQFKDDARFDRKIDKAYLDGRYGAVPIFIDFPGVNNESTNR